MGEVIDIEQYKKDRGEQGKSEKPRQMEIVDKRWEGQLRAVLHGAPDTRVNVLQYRKSHLINGTGSVLDEIEDREAEEKAGTLSSGEESPTKVAKDIEETLAQNHLEAEDDLRLVDLLDLAFKKFGMDSVFVVDQSSGQKGFDTRRLGHVEDFDKMSFVIPFGSKERMLDALRNMPADLSDPVKDRINEMTRTMGVDDLNYLDEETGFSIKFGDEKITFFYGEVKPDDDEKEGGEKSAMAA
jgi:hypothetical protein